MPTGTIVGGARTRGTYAELALVESDELLADLPVVSFDAAGHQESLANRRARASGALAAGRVAQALRGLAALMERVDGWTLPWAPTTQRVPDGRTRRTTPGGCTLTRSCQCTWIASVPGVTRRFG